MAVTANGDLYPPLPHHTMASEEGPQSSEDGSGMHSPVFPPTYSVHGDNHNLRYHDQVDVHHSAPAMIAPQYDYTQPLNAQQPPIHETASIQHHLPNSSARHSAYSNNYTSIPRNHLGLDSYTIQSPVSSRLPPPAPLASPLDYPRYTSERPLPGGPSHEPSYTHRQIPTSSGIPIEPDHRQQPEVPSLERPDDSTETSDPSTSSTEPRKETANLVIACRQCRSRKIRCDSQRPACNNCLRRSNDCQYDTVPKRRGPDKNPGTRQRSCKRRPTDDSAPPPAKRVKRSTSVRNLNAPPNIEQRDPLSSPIVKENLQDSKPLSQTSSRINNDRQPPQLPQPPQPLPPLPPLPPRQPMPEYHYHPSQHMGMHPHHPHHHHQHQHHQGPSSPTDPRIMPTQESHYKEHDMSHPYRRPPSNMYEQGSYTYPPYPRQLDVNTSSFTDTTTRRTPPEEMPNDIVEQRRGWWDRILRRLSPEHIIQELTFLVENTGHILSFINIPYLNKQIQLEEERIYLEPSFILAGLAMATLMKSSVLEGGPIKRQEAITLANDARVAFNEASQSGWSNLSLVETALILALFESSAHPQHTPSRAVNALISLDRGIIEFQPAPLSLNDLNDREADKFTAHDPPSVHIKNPVDPTLRKCTCIPPDAIEPADSTRHRTYVLPWDQNWTPEQIRAEETRRLCWSALSLVSEYIAQCDAVNETSPGFSLSNPANFCLLFPGEVIDRASATYRGVHSMSPKESVWALYCRSMLLWNFCTRFATPQGDEDRAEQASQAFQEAQAIEDGLDAHVCNLDTTLIYTTREFLHNTRMLVAEAFKGYLGFPVRRKSSFNRKQAEDWLYYESRLVNEVHRVIHKLNTPEGYLLTRRPYRINWFINQLQICLSLWRQDNTLTSALDLGKSILSIIDVLNALWQCASIESKTASLRAKLIDACEMSNQPLPFDPSITVPEYLRRAGQLHS